MIGPEPITKILLIEFNFGMSINIFYQYKKKGVTLKKVTPLKWDNSTIIFCDVVPMK